MRLLSYGLPNLAILVAVAVFAATRPGLITATVNRTNANTNETGICLAPHAPTWNDFHLGVMLNSSRVPGGTGYGLNLSSFSATAVILSLAAILSVAAYYRWQRATMAAESAAARVSFYFLLAVLRPLDVPPGPGLLGPLACRHVSYYPSPVRFGLVVLRRPDTPGPLFLLSRLLLLLLLLLLLRSPPDAVLLTLLQRTAPPRLPF